jgi:N-sulfoglucosamine sulfohydrolase
MSTPRWLLFAISGFLLLATGAASLRAAPKNVVMIVVDDQGLEAGCYGNRVIQTPNLDRLAAEGTRFNFAFCTTASCSASRSVILSGLYNHANGQLGHQHGYNNFHTQTWVKSLPVQMAEAGYRTCSIGKYHVQPESIYKFETYENQGTLGARHTVQMAENARALIEQDDPRPFFLYFCTSDPHRAREGFANGREYPGIEPVEYDPKQIPVPAFLPDEPEVRGELAEYYQAVSRLDQGLGRLISILKESGHWDDTLVLYLSDNGIPFPGAKTTLYEPGMRLPLVVRSPDQKQRGNVCNAMVTWADLMPTILDYAGAEGPDYGLHGRSFLDVLDEDNPAGWDQIFASHTFHEITMYYPMRVIRTRRYKYILNLAHALPFPFASDLYASDTWQGVLKRDDTMFGNRTVDAYLHRPWHELYDLKSDPHELVNLADDPAHAEILSKLQSHLRDWQRRTKDPWIVKYDYE